LDIMHLGACLITYAWKNLMKKRMPLQVRNDWLPSRVTFNN
jgi:hypothetical protein